MNEFKKEDKTAAVIEMLASRICHDIISPVGAINNGVELLQEMGAEAGEDAIDLISYSAKQASAKLNAFRMAYGAGGRDQNIKPEDVQKVFSGLISAEGKIMQTWDPFGKLIGAHDGPVPRCYCKMLLCSLMLAMECLHKGGRISVLPGEKNESIILAEGDDVCLREGVEDALHHRIEPEALDPRLVHPYAIRVMSEYYQYGIDIQEHDDKISILLTSPDQNG